MTEAPKSTELGAVPPAILLHQASEPDQSQGNVEENDAQNGIQQNEIGDNRTHGEGSMQKESDSQDSANGETKTEEVEGVDGEDCIEKSEEDKIAEKEDKMESPLPNLKGSQEKGDLDELSNQSKLETVGGSDLNPAVDTQEISPGNMLSEQLRSVTPEIIITPTDDDISTSAASFADTGTLGDANISSPAESGNIESTPLEQIAEDHDAERSSDRPRSQTSQASSNIQDSVTSPIEINEDKSKEKRDTVNRPPSADHPKSKSPEVDSTGNNTEQILSTTVEQHAEFESPPNDDKISGRTTKHDISQSRDSHSPQSTILEEIANEQGTPEKPSSPVESNNGNDDSKSKANKDGDTSTAGDDILSLTSDEPPDPSAHKDGYDASVSGNEDDSTDKPSYIPTAIEKSIHDEMSHVEEVKLCEDDRKESELADVASTSSETLVPTTPPPQIPSEDIASTSQSTKSVKFRDTAVVNSDSDSVITITPAQDTKSNNTDDTDIKDLAHPSQTPLPCIVKEVDLESNSEEAEPEPVPSDDLVSDDEITQEKPDKPATSELEPPSPKICDLQDRINILEKEKSLATKEVNSLSEQIKQMKSDNLNKNDLEAKIQRLEKDLEKVKKEKNELENNIPSPQNMPEDEKNDYETKIQRLKLNLEKVKKEKNELEKNIPSQENVPENKKNEYEAKIEQIKNNLEEVEKEKNQLKTKITSLESDLGKEKDETAKLRKKKSSVCIIL